MQKTSISPDIVGDFLDSAANATTKGQSQFFTPPNIAELAARPLAAHRRNVADLNCGNGRLLFGAANHLTKHLFGVDIDPVRLTAVRGAETGGRGPDTGYRIPESGLRIPGTGHPSNDTKIPRCKISGDLTRVYPLLREVDWRPDIITLNPPWDLWWHRDRLIGLHESRRPSVRTAFQGRDGRTGDRQIDSTIATWLIALDLCSDQGEGYIIANAATMDRLVFQEGAPHAALARHAWGVITIDGNPMTKDDRHAFQKGDTAPFRTMFLYWAANHTHGPSRREHAPDLRHLQESLNLLRDDRHPLRSGEEPCSWRGDDPEAALAKFQGASGEWNRICDDKNAGKSTEWNLWLNQDGTIRVNLTPFQQLSGSIDKKAASALHAIDGQHPMQLVIQRNSRQALEHAVQGGIWRVAPAVQEAVADAVREYHTNRAPLRPLNRIQRLGYLDEQDEIHCVRSMADGCFVRGATYPITTRTVSVRRERQKFNDAGEEEHCEYDGQELAILIKDSAGIDRCFMDARLIKGDTKIGEIQTVGRSKDFEENQGVDYTLEQLADHFEIPQVPDVAEMHPQSYQTKLTQMGEIMAFMRLIHHQPTT